MLRIVISQHVRYSLELTRRAAWARKAPARSRKIGVTSMKRLGKFLKAPLKLMLGFFVWLFRVVSKWAM